VITAAANKREYANERWQSHTSLHRFTGVGTLETRVIKFRPVQYKELELLHDF
jgi:hypothetical protein